MYVRTNVKTGNKCMYIHTTYLSFYLSAYLPINLYMDMVQCQAGGIWASGPMASGVRVVTLQRSGLQIVGSMDGHISRQ